MRGDGRRYLQLLATMYGEIVNDVRDVTDAMGMRRLRPHLLEYVPYSESFYHVSDPIPSYGPRQRPRGEDRTSPLLRLAPEIARHLIALQRQIEISFEMITEASEFQAWLPAAVWPEIDQILQEWRDWFAGQLQQCKRADLRWRLSNSDAVRWVTFSRLLLSITPHQMLGDDSSAFAIYRSRHYYALGLGDERVDHEGFIQVPKEPFTWRFLGNGVQLGALLDFLELLYLVPLEPFNRVDVLRSVLAPSPENIELRNNEVVKSAAKVTAFGGPMYHLGQLEGILYVPVPSDDSRGAEPTHMDAHPLTEVNRKALKQLLSNGASRRHRVREQVVRDALSREGSRSQVVAPLRLLKHIPKLYSIVAAVCVCTRRNRAGAAVTQVDLEAPKRRAMLVAEEIFRRSSNAAEALQQLARQCCTTLEVRCLDRSSEPGQAFLRSLAELWAEAGHAVRSTGCVCVVPVRFSDGVGTPDWVYFLAFREPPGSDSFQTERTEYWNSLKAGAPQMQLELQALLDHSCTVERNEWYSRVGAGVARALAVEDPQLMAPAGSGENRYLDKSCLSGSTCFSVVSSLRRRALSASLVLGKRSRSKLSVPDTVFDVRKAVEQLLSVEFVSAVPRPVIYLRSSTAPFLVYGDSVLIKHVLFELLCNALSACGTIPNTRPIRVIIAQRPTCVEVSVSNVIEKEKEAEVQNALMDAEQGVPAKARVDSTCKPGIGLASCYEAVRLIGGRLKVGLRSRSSKKYCRVLAVLRLPSPGGGRDERTFQINTERNVVAGGSDVL